MKEILSDLEKNKINLFLEDKVMSNAVKKVLLEGVYYNGTMNPGDEIDPLRNFILGAFSTQTASLLSYEEKGKKLDVMMNAISMVESGFNNLENYKKVEAEKKDNVNKAR